MDTIFAVSSGRPPAAIAVMRVSGPAARRAGEELAGSLPPPRRASLRTLRDSRKEQIDRALCLWLPGPNTATGEDLLEFHLHGGRAVIAAVEAALGAIAGLRPAEPGEFTRRALLAGRIDLAQAQGLADLLEAETEHQRRAAIYASEGALSVQVRAWLARLAAIGATIEAAIDFDDEDDVDAIDQRRLTVALSDLATELREALARPTVERSREGVRIALTGPPNVGKSSLFNALIERDAAIVSPSAGTTRDIIEASIVRRGEVYTLIDTAGLRDDAADPIERIGIDRARQARAGADVCIALGDERDGDLWAYPRMDLPERGVAPANAIGISVKDRRGLNELWRAIERLAASAFSNGRPLFHQSQREAVAVAHSALVEAVDSPDLLIRAEAVRLAGRELGKVVGIDATEAMLDALFSRFCVGK